MAEKLSKAALESLAAVTGKRAKLVAEHIAKKGAITTDEIRVLFGYTDPRRARIFKSRESRS